MIDILFPDFPREFGTKRVWVKNKKDFYKLINKYNGKIQCFTSLYGMTQYRKYNTAKIDKLFFDLDKPIECKNAASKLHDFLLNEDLKHVVLFSGAGFHVYVFVDTNYAIRDKKNALRNAQEWIAHEANLTIGSPKDADIDEHIIGDVARITRIPNTFNSIRQRFCIPLIHEDLSYTYQDIKRKAKNQQFVREVFGSKLLNLEKFDYVGKTTLIGEDYEVSDVDIKNFEIDAQPFLEKLPPVIRWLLKNCRCGFRDRYWTILAMKESGFPKSVTYWLCQKFWTPEKFYHSTREERQIDYIYKRDDLFFSFDAMKQEGYPICAEDRKFKFYKGDRR